MAADAPAAFFSYSRDDSDFALRLAKDLKVAGAVVWIDQLDIEPGMRWDIAVQDALNNCPRMLVILSPASVNSDNVLDEVSRAIRKQKSVIPVLYLDCDIPLRLERHQRIDFRTDYARGLKVLLKILGVEQPTEIIPNAPPQKERKQPSKPARTKQDRPVRKVAVGEERFAVTPADEQATGWELRELCTLTGHTSEIKAVAVTPDGQHAVSASFDQTLKVWELGSGRELRTLWGHAGCVTAVAVTPDGQRVVSASADQTLKVWELDSRRELHTLIGHADSVVAVAVTPDGQRAVSASADWTLKVWVLATGRELRTLTGHAGGVYAVAVTPDGQRVVSGSADRTLKVWELATGSEQRTLTGHARSVCSVAATPDGQCAVSAAGDPFDCSELKVWELGFVGRGREITMFAHLNPVRHTLSGHTNWVRAVAVTPEGQRAVSASWDQTLKVWDLASGRELATLDLGASLHCCAVFPDGKNILAGDERGVIHCLRLE